MEAKNSSEKIPAHIALIMDGNGRWARSRFMPRLEGHRRGVVALRRCVENCLRRGVRVLSVFAFSSENWARPAQEVGGLLDLLAVALAREVPDLAAQGVQLHFVGERENLSEKIRAGFDEAEKITAQNQALILNVCFNYGGRWDMAQAAARVAQLNLPMNEANIAAHLALSHVGEVDLLIRTGGEQRLSNFMLWQAAYAELFFSPVLWPDFGEKELDEAIAAFAARERRFGKTSAQIQENA